MYVCARPGPVCHAVERGTDGIERLVVYAGLFSHANYREASSLELYTKVLFWKSIEFKI